jgi:hypothetical protein
MQNPILNILIFILGVVIVLGTFLSALSTFVLPRAARSQLNRLVFGLLRRAFEVPLTFLKDYARRDALMAYYAPVGLMLLVPTWYALVACGYALMYLAMGAGDLAFCIRLSGSSLLTLGISSSENLSVNTLMFSEAALGLILVALLIAYLPTMYSAFSRREEAVNLLEVRAGSPPSAVQMLLRYYRIHGLERLASYWPAWEIWFADLEESHTVLPALVFFRSPRPQNSWVIAAGAVLDAASLTLSSVDIPYSAEAALAIRAGYLALRRLTDNFDIPYPSDPHFPGDPISISREEFDQALDTLATAGVPLKADRERAWKDFAGWRVNYDRVLLILCSMTMAPYAPWSSDRMSKAVLPRLFLPKGHDHDLK